MKSILFMDGPLSGEQQPFGVVSWTRFWLDRSPIVVAIEPSKLLRQPVPGEMIHTCEYISNGKYNSAFGCYEAVLVKPARTAQTYEQFLRERTADIKRNAEVSEFHGLAGRYGHAR